MPELPEVETIKRQLAKELTGKKWQGQRIVGVRRRAKLLIIDLADTSSLIFHLKLTGQLIYNGEPSRYTRKVFYFSDNNRLIFNDLRKFGWWKRVKSTKEIEGQFGPEAPEVSFNDFQNRLFKRPKSQIKPLLLDQKFIAGIGNIYADEILFDAKIRPGRRVGSLSKIETKVLLVSIKKILKAAIKAGGSSVSDYIDAKGKKGGYTKQHKVYRRAGQPCLRCSGKIERIKLAGRGTHFCPKCQE